MSVLKAQQFVEADSLATTQWGITLAMVKHTYATVRVLNYFISDIDECDNLTICGYGYTCNNTVGNYTCNGKKDGEDLMNNDLIYYI